MGPTQALYRAIAAWLDEHYPLWRQPSYTLPPGMRIEMHPSVRHCLFQDPDAMRFGTPLWGTDPSRELERVAKVPLKITTDIPRDTWRLVTVVEDVHVGGILDHRIIKALAEGDDHDAVRNQGAAPAG